MKYAIKCSYGNDSIALLQWMHEHGHAADAYVVYNDTGWSHPAWADRVERGETFARSLGAVPVRTRWAPAAGTVDPAASGFVSVVRLKKAFPRHGMQFCTMELKVKPTLQWYETVDPDADLVGVVGVRREESARRASWPEWTEESELDGSRSLWAPLVRVREDERNDLVRRAGFEVLPHRSDECFPCVNAARADLRRLADHPDRINLIEMLETDLSVGKDKPRRMFRRQGGIRETVKWALSERGKYINPEQDAGDRQAKLFECDGGLCGL